MISDAPTWGYTFWIINFFWVIWLVLSFVVSIVVGTVILRNWEIVKY